ncbi:MAG: hypothetical protein UX89_C0001G0012 [Parcubacteria group bacterium GW2011_GWA2_47_16]|nr:MAG: hypothetical protein UX89_C0001G0012 [Parcubacteria group bacterium GW2011_GWA2_47_16]
MIEVLLAALVASMKVVRKNQGIGNHEVEVKRDNSLRTITDRESEQAMLDVIIPRLSGGVGVQVEEKGMIRVGNGGLKILGDALDGTITFVRGALGSTVIIAVYDGVAKRVTLCLVGEPASGRVWVAEADKGTRVRKFDFATEQFGPEVPVHVAEPLPLGSGATVFLDLYPGFTRKDARVFSVEECVRLFRKIFGKYGVTMLGSNGIHHALVANGAEGVAGAITTAIGGPWDVAPALLVLQAGGFARAFSVEPDGSLKEQDPLDVFSYHFLVTGNTQATVDELSEALLTVSLRA